jgi:hypothetical protein
LVNTQGGCSPDNFLGENIGKGVKKGNCTKGKGTVFVSWVWREVLSDKNIDPLLLFMAPIVNVEQFHG